MHARKSGVQSTKPNPQKLTTNTNPTNVEEEQDDLLEQQLLDRKENVGAHVDKL